LDSWNLHKEKSYAPLDLPNVFVASTGYLESGFPTDIRTPNTSSAVLFTTYNLPDQVLGQSMYLPNRGPNGWFNLAAFSQPGPVRNVSGTPITLFGDLARRAGRGPGTKDLAAFNLTNIPASFLPAANTPGLTIGNANFGKLNASAATGRQIQFGLKLYF
jgi:hypothetical protein